MINHESILLALRAQLETLSVATTGSASITATATGYTRSTGSFITDGFAPGMELVGTGFSESANNDAKTLTEVGATVLTCPGTTAEAVGTRTLSVGVPSVASENVHFEPTQGSPWFEENYLPGPMETQSLGSLAELEILPSYVVKVFVPANTAVSGVLKYADKLLTLFAPGTALTVSGHTVWVRKDVAPFSGQVLPVDGWSFVAVTVPLRVRTANAI